MRMCVYIDNRFKDWWQCYDIIRNVILQIYNNNILLCSLTISNYMPTVLTSHIMLKNLTPAPPPTIFNQKYDIYVAPTIA